MKHSSPAPMRKSARLSGHDVPSRQDREDMPSTSRPEQISSSPIDEASDEAQSKRKRGRSRLSKLVTSPADLDQETLPDSFMPHVEGAFSCDDTRESHDLSGDLSEEVASSECEDSAGSPGLPESSMHVEEGEQSSPLGMSKPPEEEEAESGEEEFNMFEQSGRPGSVQGPDSESDSADSSESAASTPAAGTSSDMPPPEPYVVDWQSEKGNSSKEASATVVENGSSSSGASGKLGDQWRWSAFHMDNMEALLEDYAEKVERLQKENAELREENNHLRQNLERHQRRTGAVAPAAVAPAAAAPAAAAPTPKCDDSSTRAAVGDAASGAEALPVSKAAASSSKRASDRMLRGSSVAPRIGCSSSQGTSSPLPTNQLKSSLPGPSSGAEAAAQAVPRDHPLKGHPRRLEKLVTNMQRALAEAGNRPEPEAGMHGIAPPSDWYIFNPPTLPDSGRSRRSQGPASDIHALMALELDEQSLARAYQRGEIEEKRRIRWDMQSKREKTKRAGSEMRDPTDDEGTEGRHSTRVTRQSSGKTISEMVSVKRSERLRAAVKTTTKAPIPSGPPTPQAPKLVNFVFLGPPPSDLPGIP